MFGKKNRKARKLDAAATEAMIRNEKGKKSTSITLECARGCQNIVGVRMIGDYTMTVGANQHYVGTQCQTCSVGKIERVT